jgi:hypothetical protein
MHGEYEHVQVTSLHDLLPLVHIITRRCQARLAIERQHQHLVFEAYSFPAESIRREDSSFIRSCNPCSFHFVGSESHTR